MKNQQVVTTKKGDIDVMQLQTNEINPPLANEVQVKILATGISWADIMIRRGGYPGTPKFPLVQGYEFVGEVVALGSSVDKKWLRQKVAAIIQWGAYSQYINVDLNKIMEVPNEIDLNAASCLPLNYTTAYQLLTRKAKVKSGDVVLIHGAGGGVGSAAVQIAKQLQLKVYATLSKEKMYLFENDSITLIDYKTQDFESIIKSKEPNGIDAYLDVGGRTTFDKSYGLLKPGGHGITFGFLEIKKPFHFIELIAKLAFRNLFSNKNVSMFSIMKGKMKMNLEYVEDFNTLVAMLQKKEIKPIIAKKIRLADIPNAHRDFENHQFVGKVIINPNTI